MALKPWMNSSDIISAVKRKIAIPINQRTFSEEDILAFANEEMMISQVPDIMIYHQEYFVVQADVLLNPNQVRYAIPERALGQKLRDIFYKDINGNLFEMTRVEADDKSYWQRESGTTSLMLKYYLEGNDVVLAPLNVNNPTGFLQFSYFLRPNQLVPVVRAAISNSFFKNVTINNATLAPGDTLKIQNVIFTAVAGAPAVDQFQIGASSIDTASNLATAIGNDNTFTANNGSPSSNIISIYYVDQATKITTNNIAAFNISTQLAIQFNDTLPSNIIGGINIDFLQTKPGHKTLKMSVPVINNSTSVNSIIFNDGVIPTNFIVGDYICEEYECIIPQIPPDLHNGLAERVCARILAAQGDAQGLQIVNGKLQAITKAEGTLLDNRVDGSTQKVTQRKSLISWMRMGLRRRI